MIAASRTFSSSSRNRCSDSSSCASFSFWSVTSKITPCMKRAVPDASRTGAASSRNQRTRPSTSISRYSAEYESPDSTASR